MIEDLHNLKKFMGLFDVAKESGSQEVRLSITEMSLIVSDLDKLLSLKIQNETPIINDTQVEMDFDGGAF